MPSSNDDERKQINVRLHLDAIRMLVELERYFGLTRTGVLEILVREKARALGLDDPVKVAAKAREGFRTSFVRQLPGPCESLVFGNEPFAEETPEAVDHSNGRS